MNSSPKRAPQTALEKRQSLRLDKVFPVWVSSAEHGEMYGVARNISAGGIFIETPEPLPLGAHVRVHFCVPESDAEIVARGEVKNHYFFNYAAGPLAASSIAGMGIRFSGFEEDGAETLDRSLRGLRVLH
jgi:hypothetical protein